MNEVRTILSRELNVRLTGIGRELSSALECLNDGEIVQALARIDVIKEACGFDPMLYQIAEICDKDLK